MAMSSADALRNGAAASKTAMITAGESRGA
jgi:hypothetical protein